MQEGVHEHTHAVHAHSHVHTLTNTQTQSQIRALVRGLTGKRPLPLLVGAFSCLIQRLFTILCCSLVFCLKVAYYSYHSSSLVDLD